MWIVPLLDYTYCDMLSAGLQTMSSGGLWDTQVEFVDATYGKTGVKILYISRDSSRHEITEYEGTSYTPPHLCDSKHLCYAH